MTGSRCRSSASERPPRQRNRRNPRHIYTEGSIEPAAADAVTAWIAETLRPGIPKDKRRAGIPRAPGRRARSRHPERRLVCRWL